MDQLLSMMEALQEQIAGSASAQKEEARVRRKLSGSTETDTYLGWDGVNFYIQGGRLNGPKLAHGVGPRREDEPRGPDGYFARPWNMGVARRQNC